MSFENLEKLVDIVKKLRDPIKGCPWDLKQTHQSLLKYLIEESFEFVHATESQDFSKMEDELGDILLQVMLHSSIASEKKNFDFESVCKKLSEKLIRRHPHVFNENEAPKSVLEIEKTWQKIKKQEKMDQKDENLFDPSYFHMPALYSSVKIGKATTDFNFDWENYQQVLYKVEEEWQELKEELGPQDTFNRDRVVEELGDFLFSSAQLARHLKIDPEEALRLANQKFVNRFNKVHLKIKKSNRSLEDCTQNELEEVWNEVKFEEKN